MLGLFKNIVKKNKSHQCVDQSTGEPAKPESECLPQIPPEYAQFYHELPTRYILQEKIGEGAFSIVLRAYDTETRQPIAIKIIDKTTMRPEQINSVLKEIAIMSRLDNPYIAKLYGHLNSSASKYCFLYLEYIPGGEIFNQIIKYTYFSEDLSRHVIRQVALAVKYLHSNGIVHRDIKPENLLFVPNEFVPRSKAEQKSARRRSDDDNKLDEGRFVPNYGAAGIGTVKLADFGLSTVLYNESMQAKTPCGTVGYTSPEQHLNLGYTKKVDMWAIGCVLYTLVVGFPPFYSATQDSKDISTKVSRGDYKFLSPWFDEVSDDCKRLIANLLTVDPEVRYSIDQLLKDPWMAKGYEHEPVANTCTETVPETTFDKQIYMKLNRTADNLADGLLTPRAEAIRLVFDTANVVQRESTPPVPQTRMGNLAIVEENEPMDVLELCRHQSSDSSESDEREVDDSDDESEFEDSDLNPKPYSKFSSSPSYKEKPTTTTRVRDTQHQIHHLGGGSTDTADSATVNEESSILTSEIEDFNTGTKRKSSVSFQVKSGRCGFAATDLHTSSISSGATTEHVAHVPKQYPRTPQTSTFAQLEEDDEIVHQEVAALSVEDTTPVEAKRPSPTKKYTASADQGPIFDGTLSNSFDLKLNNSKLLERRKVKASLEPAT
ncbi:hypothetical protein OGAPHI_004579 [Ogataea philodendri]|uniref:Protein kinase domain-containing protein n=1 Tax=Ogataea philodendri TaxID=1378263 RepID=A0A9P8P298_9ASCO|nr:uncharacterized protein OGAPHI_004579 [Ogataea philodendri]KAH3664228.1 hypothetical protein OGAPHI_004579 [Ogataea philodendri]